MLHVHVSQATGAMSSDPACGRVGSGYDCTVDADTTFTFALVNVVSGASVGLEVAAPSGYLDPDGDNNRTSVSTRSALGRG